MKYWYALIFMFFTSTLFAQVKKSSLYGIWVASKLTYADGSGLSDENVLKYSYFKYQFSRPDKLNISTSYDGKGPDNTFEFDGASLQTHSPEGYLLNSFHVEMIKDTLILVQKSQNDLDEHQALKFYFIPETTYQKSIGLKGSDIYSIKGGYTVYRSSPKIYASYNGNWFPGEMYAGIKERISMSGRVGHLAAGFIISKTGYADSLKILEGVDDKFDKQFIKVFNQTKRNWKPATLNGKSVSVYTMVDLTYSTSPVMIPTYFSMQKANAAYNDKDYKLALYYYDLALNVKPLNAQPFRKENLYKRGMCKLCLGNSEGACEDWNMARELGDGGAVDAVIEKYCR